MEMYVRTIPALLNSPLISLVTPIVAALAASVRPVRQMPCKASKRLGKLTVGEVPLSVSDLSTHGTDNNSYRMTPYLAYEHK